MKESAYWIDRLGLAPHPEGGWFKETYRSAETLAAAGLPERFGGDRAFCTAIYFLLESGQFSAFHRIKSDELWFFHAGSAMAIHCLTADGQHRVIAIGPDHGQNAGFHAVVPAGSWFGAQPLEPDSFSLVSCTVAPGFDFSDFEMAERAALLALFPQQREIIVQLTRN
jgi:predicted cupin superfamily sugar epimerase